MTTRRVLILGTECGDIAGSVARSFQAIGWDTRLLVFGRQRASLFTHLLAPIGRSSQHSSTATSFNRAIQEQVLPLLRTLHFDLLVILKGDALDDETSRALRHSRIPIVAWIYDSVSRFPYVDTVASVAHDVYCIDSADVPRLGAGTTWLPLGFDQNIYKPSRGSKDIDVLVIGTVGSLYSKRRGALLTLAESSLARSHACAFIGSSGEIAGNARLLVRLSRTPLKWLSRRMPPVQLAHYISRSKVCINVHQDDGVTPINPFFFAIPACGTCEVAEDAPHLAHWLDPSKEYVPFREGTLLTTLEALLANENRRASVEALGLHAVTQRHSMVDRVRTIVTRLESSSLGRRSDSAVPSP